MIAKVACIYGYPLVTTNATRVQMSNVPAVEALCASVNSFINVKRYPPADYRGVSASNADTLSSVAWLDLAKAPTSSPILTRKSIATVRRSRARTSTR